MIKRIVILVFILSTFTVLVLAPLNVSAASQNAPKLQATVEVTVAVETVPPESTSAPIPVTGSDGTTLSTWIIFGLLAILGAAVVIGGIALVNRRQM